MKLKTLKDLEEKFEFLTGDINMVISEKLKKEAIKWVKAFDKMGETITCLRFIDFFNITEDELKWKYQKNLFYLEKNIKY